MKAIKVKGSIIGKGIDYYKFVRDLSDAAKQLIKTNADKETFFYIKQKGEKKHYKCTGYKVVIYNRDRYEFYHREPSLNQLVAILRKEKLIK